MSEWDQYLEEYLTTPKKAVTAALGMVDVSDPTNPAKNVLYSAAPVAEEKGTTLGIGPAHWRSSQSRI